MPAFGCILLSGLSLATGQPPQQPAPAPPRIPSIFVPPEPLDYDNHDGWTSLVRRHDAERVGRQPGGVERRRRRHHRRVDGGASGRIHAFDLGRRRGRGFRAEARSEARRATSIAASPIEARSISIERSGGRAGQPAAGSAGARAADPCRLFRAIRGGRSTARGSTMTTTG